MLLLFPPLNPPPPPPLPDDAVLLLLRPADPVPLGGAPAEFDRGTAPPPLAPLALDVVVDAWLCDPFAIAANFLNKHAPMRDTKSSRNKTLVRPCKLPVLLLVVLLLFSSFGVAWQSRVEWRGRKRNSSPLRMVGLPIWMDRLDIHPSHSSIPLDHLVMTLPRVPPLSSLSQLSSNYLPTKSEKVFLPPSDVTRRMRRCHVASRVTQEIKKPLTNVYDAIFSVITCTLH